MAIQHSNDVFIVRGVHKGRGTVVETIPLKFEINVEGRNVYILASDIVRNGDQASIVNGNFIGRTGTIVKEHPKKVVVQLNSNSYVTVSDNFDTVQYKDLVLKDNTYFQVDSVDGDTFVGRRVPTNSTLIERINVADVLYIGFSQSESDTQSELGYSESDYSDDESEENNGMEVDYSDFEDYVESYSDLSRVAQSTTSGLHPIGSLLADVPVDTNWIIEKYLFIERGLQKLQNNDTLYIVACLVYFNYVMSRQIVDLTFEDYINKLLSSRSEFGMILGKLTRGMSTILSSIFLENISGIPDITDDNVRFVQSKINTQDIDSIIRFILTRCKAAIEYWLGISENLDHFDLLQTDQLRKMVSDINLGITIVSNKTKKTVIDTLYKRDVETLLLKYTQGLSKRFQSDALQYIINGLRNPSSVQRDSPYFTEFTKYYERFERDKAQLKKTVEQYTSVDDLASSIARTQLV
ncbi:hypothetical protein EB118_03160 [bacterium]|nr:hypothetical protein [bacterium]NDC93963.1 hypothetical protein [bacterium]NDD83458.1 hypothetical protein [bacterium]NDG29083.1 hypothetical protein [bacterium]